MSEFEVSSLDNTNPNLETDVSEFVGALAAKNTVPGARSQVEGPNPRPAGSRTETSEESFAVGGHPNVLPTAAYRILMERIINQD